MTLDDLLNVQYVDNGRLPSGSDCYGLTRLARVYLFGKTWMPEHGDIDGADKRAMTGRIIDQAKSYREIPASPGAIAICYRGKICTHIAIVVDIDGRLMILETNEETGTRLVPIRKFEKGFLKVVYYDD